jgi:hypothetical protein
MPSLFDVPTDVVKFVLFPLLDPLSRFIANDVFAPSKEIEYRIVNRIPKSIIISLQIHIETFQMKTLLNLAWNSNKLQIKALQHVVHGGCDTILQHNPGFRSMMYVKVQYYLNENTYSFLRTPISKNFKRGFKSVARKISQRLENLPFKNFIHNSNLTSYYC